MVQLAADFGNGVGVAPLKLLVNRIELSVNNTKIRNKLPILLHSLHHVSKLKSTPTPQGLKVRQALLLNDSMMYLFSEGHPKRLENIRVASRDPAVRDLVQNL